MPYIPRRKKKDEKEKEKEDNAEKEAFKKIQAKPVDIDLLKLEKAYAELKESHQKIQETHYEMILRLAIAAEFKDPDTGQHILRIGDYSTAIARQIKLSAHDLEILRYASPMHDIGKIGIPDAILQKPAKLNADEWRIMEQHTVIGAQIFKSAQSPFLRAVSEIALTHHERFDGRGYPNGIPGGKIPIFGRIVAVADIFDALVSKRCYKEAWPFEDGVEYVESLSGSHLDPDLVGAFIKAQEEIRSIYQANKSINEFVKDFHETLESKD